MNSTDEQVIFADNFDGGVDPSWSWIREHPGFWRTTDDGLEIRAEPGKADTVRNALVRPAPDRNAGTFAIEVTVTNHTSPTEQYEQAGITWYHDGEPVFKEVKELVDGKIFIIPGKAPMPAASVRIRLVVTANSWEAQYRADGDAEFQTAATGELPAPGDDQVSIQCYNGPSDGVTLDPIRGFLYQEGFVGARR